MRPRSVPHAPNPRRTSSPSYRIHVSSYVPTQPLHCSHTSSSAPHTLPPVVRLTRAHHRRICSSSIARAYSLLRALATPRASTPRLLRRSLHPVRRNSLSHRLCSSRTIVALCAIFILHAPSYAPHTDLSTLGCPLRLYEPFSPLMRVFTLTCRLRSAYILSAPYANQVRHAYVPHTPPPLLIHALRSFMHYCTVRTVSAPHTLARCLRLRAPSYVPHRYLPPSRIVSAPYALCLPFVLLYYTYILFAPQSLSLLLVHLGTVFI
jgi:hypothetical protein